jgi:hypothetical protein
MRDSNLAMVPSSFFFSPAAVRCTSNSSCLPARSAFFILLSHMIFALSYSA